MGGEAVVMELDKQPSRKPSHKFEYESLTEKTCRMLDTRCFNNIKLIEELMALHEGRIAESV